MTKGIKLFLLVLFTAIVAGGVGFLAYEVHSQVSTARTEDSEEKNNTKTSDSSLSDNAQATAGTDDQDTGYILIGDSRFVGMDQACEITDNATNHEYVVAKVGEGYQWFVNTALTEARDIVRTHTWISRWKYVICLGVNDLWDFEKYKDEYLTLKSDHDLILVSVGPTGPSSTVSNDDVTVFNQQLRNFCDENDIPYIDYNTTITGEGFTTQDGLHYTNTIYKRIYEIIEEGMRGQGATATVSPSPRSE